MIRINLLPVRQMKQKTQAQKQLAVGGIVIVAVLVLLALGTLYLGSTVKGLEGKITLLETEKKRLKEVLDTIDNLKKKKDAVEKQINIVQDLKDKSILTVRVLDEVARITPHERMWLTSLDQGGGSLKINGMALDNRTVANYLEDLKGSEYISDVTLVSSSLAKYAGRNLKSFVLSCAVALPNTDDKDASPETSN